ncbi:MAG: hypothetical protein K2K07_00405 [Lachnospiraceae bacterium]|nr:hypothetical protein [Lachnospiraceae bacterium]
MKCTLMNKNVPVVDLELDDDTAAITRVLAPLDLRYLPVGIGTGTGIPNKRDLNEWWYGRAIPASRSGIRSALEKMNVNRPEQLLMKCYGLSLSDQYWMKPADSELAWSAVNFFENKFSDDVGNILFEQPVNGLEIDMMSPCNTSDGWLKKKYVSYSLLWENGVPYSVCEDFIYTDTELVSAGSISRHVNRNFSAAFVNT